MRAFFDFDFLKILGQCAILFLIWLTFVCGASFVFFTLLQIVNPHGNGTGSTYYPPALQTITAAIIVLIANAIFVASILYRKVSQ